jgi:hypothetical protein
LRRGDGAEHRQPVDAGLDVRSRTRLFRQHRVYL